MVSDKMQTHRPVVMGINGMVSTGHPLASAEALGVLREGGNAIDAALTAAGVLSVVKSYHCGLGGDAFGLFYSAKDQRVFALNGTGRSPGLLRKEQYKDGIPTKGILAATVPGAVDAWIQLAERFASRSLEELLQPAIRYAAEGFPVFPHLAGAIQTSWRTLEKDVEWARIFVPHGTPPRVGELLVQEDLGRSLDEIAAKGREAFYEGGIARAFVSTSEQRNGCFSVEDFREHRSRWEQPIHLGYRGCDVYVPPPNSYGLLLLLQLRVIEQAIVNGSEENIADYVGVQVDAKEQASREGDRWIADPDKVNREELENFLRQFCAKEAADMTAAGLSLARQGDTTYIATADRQGNWASLIQSVHHGFGCGVVANGTGIVLNNRMPGFNLISGHPNEIGPRKLPGHTLSPAMILKDGAPIVALGTPGGLGQTQFLAQIIYNYLNLGMNVQEAIEAPRWRGEKVGEVDVEARFPDEVKASLEAKGFKVGVKGSWEYGFGGAEAISIDSNTRVLMAGADPRRDGYAIGY